MTSAADLLDLSSRVAVLTGGSGGIGRAIAEGLSRAGARVFSLDLPGTTPPPSVESLPTDVASSESVNAALDLLMGRAGRLDFVIHCAGITADRVLWKLDDESWSRVLRVNLDAAFYLLRASVPHLRAAGAGSVVFISSINGERGKFGQSNYVASKAGLIGLGRTAARELGRFGVRVNIVAPGMILTPMAASLPADVIARAKEESVLGRLGAPEDIANAVLFLCSPLSRQVTGQTLRVDGGQLIG